jgi:hypothetical protein
VTLALRTAHPFKPLALISYIPVSLSPSPSLSSTLHMSSPGDEEFERLQREELERAQRAAQQQRESGQSSIPLRLPVGPSKSRMDPEERPQNLETRMAKIEELLLKLAVDQKSSVSEEPRQPAKGMSETKDYHYAARIEPVTESSQIPIRNRRFVEVLSTSTYRLRDRNEQLPLDQSLSLTQVSNQIRPRMDGYYFSGENPLKVLPFLRHLTRIADQSRISEATILWIVEDFLQSPARESFRAQAHTTWPEAVHWLLITFAPESSLESAVRKLNLSSQGPLEKVKQFGLRLQLEASTLGTLISLSEVKALFSQGLADPIRSLFAAHQPVHELEDTTPLSVLVARAELLETGTASRSTSTRAITRSNLPALATPEIQEDTTNLGVEEEDAAVLAFGSSSGPQSMTCFVCYQQGHWWIDCPLLSHLSAEEKEEIAVRRRTYYANASRHPRTPQELSARTSGSNEPYVMRPGWQTERGMVRPASIWPATAVENKKDLSVSKKAPATPKEE